MLWLLISSVLAATIAARSVKDQPAPTRSVLGHSTAFTAAFASVVVVATTGTFASSPLAPAWPEKAPVPASLLAFATQACSVGTFWGSYFPINFSGCTAGTSQARCSIGCL